MTVVAAPDLGLQVLSLALIDESPLNHRRHFDPKKLEELAESIRSEGLLSPVLVRPKPDGRYELAAGHRRRRAAGQAGLQEIPAIVRPMTDEQFLVTLVTENLQREDLHPLDEAEGYRDLLGLAGYDVEAVAAKVGKSVSYVYQRIKLLELIPPAQKQFLAGKLTAGHAILLARLQPDDQREALKQIDQPDEWMSEEPMSVRQLAHWIRDELLLDLAGAAFPKADATLVAAAGPCTSCPKRTGYTPDLFADLEPGKKQPDRCLDRTCFQQKTDAFLTRQRNKLEAEHGAEVLMISTAYQSDVAGALTSDRWREVKKTDPQAKPALVVDGRGTGAIKYVSTERPRPEPASPNYDRQSKAELARAKKQKLEQESKAAGRRRLWDAVAEKVQQDEDFTKGIPANLLETLISQLIGRLWNEHAKLACRLLGLEIKKRKHAYGPDGTLRAYAKSLARADQGRFLVQLALVSHFDRSNAYYAGDAKDQLAAVARLYKLNPETLVQQGSTAFRAAREQKRTATRAAKKNGKPKPLAGDVRRAAAKKKAKAAK